VTCQNRDFHLAAKWCILAKHSLFHIENAVNEGILARRLMTCMRETKDFDGFMNTYQNLGERVKNMALTQFLLYEAAMDFSNTNLGKSMWPYLIQAKESLTTLSRCNDLQPLMLYACAKRAQDYRVREVELLSLRLAWSIIREAHKEEVRLFPFFRCIIRLLKDEDGNKNDEVIESLCAMFAEGNFG